MNMPEHKRPRRRRPQGGGYRPKPKLALPGAIAATGKEQKEPEKKSLAKRLLDLLTLKIHVPAEKVTVPTPDPIMPKRTESRRILISMEALETRVALLTGKRLDEFQIERRNQIQMSGAVYLGRVCNLEASLEAAFVDIGAEKNAFLHYRDMLPMTHDLSERIGIPETKGPKKRDFNSKLAERLRKLELTQELTNTVIEREKKLRSGQITSKDIPKLFPSGSEVLVQVSKGPIGTKGPRVTTNISIPGRYLVLLPYSDHISISKKIDDRKERERLKEILSSFDLPKGIGLICRTIGEGRKREHFENDLSLLLEIWQNIDNALLKPKPPVCLYREPNLLELTVRDFLTEDIDEIVVDSDEAHQLLLERIQAVVGDKELAFKIKRYNKSTPMFDEYGVSKQISQIFSRKVPLKSGGDLCIEETEALVSIDVNTGRAKGGKDLPETILATNLEAAEEAARQLRLRNLGGLIVIDFIDMIPERHRRELYQAMRGFMREDRVKTEISPISRFGLMEMTRRREHESLLKTVSDDCPYCNGRGKIRSLFSMSIEIHRRIQEMLKRKNVPIRVLMHPAVLARMKKEDTVIIDELEKKFGTTLSFRPDETLHLEEFKLVDPTNGQEYPNV